MTLKSGPNLGQLVNGAPGEAHYSELMRQWRAFDALIQPSVISRVAALPSTGMADGDRYLLTGGANVNKIARYSVDLTTPGWEYYTPKSGWQTWSTADAKAYRFNGTTWVEESSGGGGGGPSGTEVNVQTGTAYTLVLADAFKMVTMDNAGTNTLTVPPNTAVAFPANTRIDLGQDGAGQTTIVAGAGVTIRTPETLKLRKQWSKASLIRRAANVWDLVGDLEAAT